MKSSSLRLFGRLFRSLDLLPSPLYYIKSPSEDTLLSIVIEFIFVSSMQHHILFWLWVRDNVYFSQVRVRFATWTKPIKLNNVSLCRVHLILAETHFWWQLSCNIYSRGKNLYMTDYMTTQQMYQNTLEIFSKITATINCWLTAIYPVVVKIFHLKPKMSTPWWHQKKVRRSPRSVW